MASTSATDQAVVRRAKDSTGSSATATLSQHAVDCTRSSAAATMSTRSSATGIASKIVARISSTGRIPKTISRGASVHLDPDVFRLVAFDASSKHLLRACRADCALKWAGRIFQGSGGSRITYNYSFVVDKIDTFLSHNWTTPRRHKFVALSFHLNFKFAAVAVGIFSGVVLILGTVGRMPSIRLINHTFITHDFDDGVVCRMASIPFFLLVLFTSRDFLGACGIRGPTMFLDKVCIAQHDDELKMQGILKLGAFIRHSDQLLILYTDEYLKKLWTVFEIASFLAVHEVDDMKILPISRSNLVITSLVGAWAYSAILPLVCMLPAKLNLIAAVAVLPAATLYTWCARSWSKNRNRLKERLASFTVRDCICFCEADRPVVYNNIGMLMRAIGLVAGHASEVDALTAFDDMVKEKLASAISLGLGRRMMSFSEYLLLGWVFSGAEMVDFACALGYGMPVSEWFAGMLFIATWFLMWPMLLIISEELASTRLHLVRWKGALWIGVTVCVMIVVGFLLQQLTRFLFERAASEAWALAVQITMVTMGLVVLIVVPTITPLYQRCYKGQVKAVDDEPPDQPAAAVNEGSDIHDPEHGTGNIVGEDCVGPIAEQVSEEHAAGLHLGHSVGSAAEGANLGHGEAETRSDSITATAIPIEIGSESESGREVQEI